MSGKGGGRERKSKKNILNWSPGKVVGQNPHIGEAYLMLSWLGCSLPSNLFSYGRLHLLQAGLLSGIGTSRGPKENWARYSDCIGSSTK